MIFIVIPAQAGIHTLQPLGQGATTAFMDSRLRGNDGIGEAGE
jgi:hypothetical protein